MSSIENIVMSRVHRIHALRRVFGPTALKLYGLGVFALGLFSTVSVANVVANTPSAPLASARYLLHALAQTDVLVQVLVLGIMLSAVMLARDLFRTADAPKSSLRHA